MTFKDYVAQCRLKADGPSDVLRLARRDAALPVITSERQLRTYLENKGLPASITENAPKAWARYLDFERENGRGPTA